MADGAGAGWRSDPTGRHELRYHDEVGPTSYVSDGGVVGTDDVPVTIAPDPPSAVVAAPYDPTGAPNAPDMAQPAPPAPSYVPTGPWLQAPAPPIAPAGPPDDKRGRRRVGLLVAIGIAVLEAVAIVALSIALWSNGSTTSSRPVGSIVPPTGSYPIDRGTVVYSSTFGHGDDWATGSIDDNTTASVSSGHYVVRASDHYHHVLDMPYGTAHLGISVRADASDFPSHDISMGVGCLSDTGVDPTLVYQLIVYPDGSWWIEQARLSGSITILTSGQSPALGTTATLQLTCVITQVSSAQTTTQLVGFVNGSQVAAIGHQLTHVSPNGYVPALVVGTFGQHVQMSFGGIHVRSIISATAGQSDLAPPQLSGQVHHLPPAAGTASSAHT